MHLWHSRVHRRLFCFSCLLNLAGQCYLHAQDHFNQRGVVAMRNQLSHKQPILDLLVHPLHHPIALRVERSGDGVLNVKLITHSCPRCGSELRTMVSSDGSWHAKPATTPPGKCPCTWLPTLRKCPRCGSAHVAEVNYIPRFVVMVSGMPNLPPLRQESVPAHDCLHVLIGHASFHPSSGPVDTGEEVDMATGWGREGTHQVHLQEAKPLLLG
jgi:hypothetical protein